MFSVENLKADDSIRLQVYPESTPLEDKIIFIQPGRFFRVEFVTEDGNVLKESYLFMDL